MEKNETPLGESKISKKWQICLISQVQPHLDVERGGKIRYILRDGKVYLEVVKNESERNSNLQKSGRR